MNGPKEAVETRRIEIGLLLEAIYLKYGYDFRNYARAHVKRRIEHRLAMSELSSVSQLQHKVLHDPGFFDLLLLDLSINVTAMFRDPEFYRAVRSEVAPHLETYPFIRVWHAGCSAGQEVYSMAILLKEEGLKERAQVYATDFNELILKRAKDGIYPADRIREYTANYQAAGGRRSFADYYTARYDSVAVKGALKERILFSQHNLATDGVFGEMNLILCRNVLIYFDQALQDRAVKLFYDSLCPGGFLCLGSRESLKFSEYADRFEPVSEKFRIFRKRRGKATGGKRKNEI